MHECNGWILQLQGDQYVAIGELELVHVIPDSPELFSVPQSPYYCRYVVIWHGQLLPVMDLASCLAGKDFRSQVGISGLKTLVAVIAYQAHRQDEAQYGALLLSKLPERIKVGDAQACTLPEHPEEWATLAISCFAHPNYGPIPILDLPYIFSSALAVSPKVEC